MSDFFLYYKGLTSHMCKIIKEQHDWKMYDGNTYQIHRHSSITSMYH